MAQNNCPTGYYYDANMRGCMIGNPSGFDGTNPTPAATTKGKWWESDNILNYSNAAGNLWNVLRGGSPTPQNVNVYQEKPNPSGGGTTNYLPWILAGAAFIILLIVLLARRKK